MGVSRDCPNFWVPLLFQERVKLLTSNFVCTNIGLIGTTAHEEFWEKKPWALLLVVHFQAHRPVIFAVAQLSCSFGDVLLRFGYIHNQTSKLPDVLGSQSFRGRGLKFLMNFVNQGQRRACGKLW